MRAVVGDIIIIIKIPFWVLEKASSYDFLKCDSNFART